MFENGALNLGVDLLRLAGEQLCLARDHIGSGRDAESVAALGDLQRLGLGDDGVVQQLFQLILGAQLKIIGRKFGLRGQPRGRERRGTRLGGGHIAFGAAADPAPDVEVPIGRDARAVGILGARLGSGAPGGYPAVPPALVVTTGWPWRCIPRLAAMVGQKPARACATSARDCSKAASAALTF